MNSAFTLLEIMLALSILVIGIAAVVQTTNSARQNTARAEDLTRIQNVCTSVMNQFAAGSAPIPAEAVLAIPNMPNEQIIVKTFPAPAALPHLIVLQLSVGTEYQLFRFVEKERIQSSVEQW